MDSVDYTVGPIKLWNKKTTFRRQVTISRWTLNMKNSICEVYTDPFD